MKNMQTGKPEKPSPLLIDNLLSGLGPAVLKSIRDPFQIISGNHSIIWMNGAMGRLYGIDPDEAVGRVCYRYIFGRDEPCEPCVIQDVLKAGRTHINERWKDFPNGVRRHGEVRAYPVRGDDNRVSAIIIIVIDITEKKKKLQDQQHYSEMLASKLSEKSEIENTRGPGNNVTFTAALSNREREVLRLITEGFTNKHISGLLGISNHTVKTHVTSIFNKLGVNDRTQAAVIAFRKKLV